MSDKPYRLAYALALRAIDDQAKVVDNIRARAGTIFAATALVTCFLGGQALARVRREHPAADLVLLSWTSLAIASFVAGAALSLAVLLPYRLRFSVSARELIGLLDSRATDEPVSDHEAYRELALRHEAMYDFNARAIRGRLMWYFRAAILSCS